MRGSELGVVTVACVAALLAGCSDKDEAARKKDERSNPIPVQVRTVEQKAEPRVQRYSADLRPDTDVAVSFKVGGYITSLGRVVDPATKRQRNIDIGDTVRAGATLASVRQSDYKVQVDAAQAQTAQAQAGAEANTKQVAQARAQLDKAAADWTRAQALYQARALTRPNYDAAKAQFDAAQAQWEAAQKNADAGQARIGQALAQERQASIALGDTHLAAPFSGVILRKMVETGQLVGPGTPAFVLGDVSSMKAEFGVPAEQIGALREGQALSLTIDALPDRTFQGHIRTIAPAADQQNRTFLVQVGVPNPARHLRAGMIGTVLLSTGSQQEVLTVPFGALVAAKSASDAFDVYVLSEESGSTRARVQRVHLIEVRGDRAVITEGIRPGSRVIVRPSNQVIDGVLVKVQ